jgi:hypothetical protein
MNSIKSATRFHAPRFHAPRDDPIHVTRADLSHSKYVVRLSLGKVGNLFIQHGNLTMARSHRTCGESCFPSGGIHSSFQRRIFSRRNRSTSPRKALAFRRSHIPMLSLSMLCLIFRPWAPHVMQFRTIGIRQLTGKLAPARPERDSQDCEHFVISTTVVLHLIQSARGILS